MRFSVSLLSGSQVEILVDDLRVMELPQNRGTESALGMTGIQFCKSRRPLAIREDRLTRDMASLYQGKHLVGPVLPIALTPRKKNREKHRRRQQR